MSNSMLRIMSNVRGVLSKPVIRSLFVPSSCALSSLSLSQLQLQSPLLKSSLTATAPAPQSQSISTSTQAQTPNTLNTLNTSSKHTSFQKQHYSSTPPTPQKSFSINSPTELTPAEIEALVDRETALFDAEQAGRIDKKWKPGYRRRPLSVSHDPLAFEREANPDRWISRLDRRCGALAIKLGMTPIWDDWGERIACTVLMVDANVVLRTFTEEEDGYCAVQLGAGARKRKNVGGTVMGHYLKYLPHLRVEEGDGRHPAHYPSPPYLMREFRVTHPEYLPEPGTRIHARHFVPGQNIDLSGTSKGKGFQGAMKKWNFKGMPATHGTSRSHRSLGSTGQCQDPGRVFKGKKMAGRMGGVRRTVQNARVVRVDRGRDLIYVKGNVPGQNGEFVELRDAVKRPLFGGDKVEDGVMFPPLPTFDYEDGVDGCGEAGFEVDMPVAGNDPFYPVGDQAA